MGFKRKRMEQGGKESDCQETALKKGRGEEEAGRGDNAEEVGREGAESDPQENAVEEGNQKIEGGNQENAPNRDDLIPKDNALLKSLSKFLKSTKRGYLSRSEYSVIIEFVKEKLHPEIDPRRVMERLETIRENFMAAPLFEVSRRLWSWKEGGRPISRDERRAQENVQEKRCKRRGREESVDEENPQKQGEGQEGNDFPADIDLLKTLWEHLKDHDKDFKKLDDYRGFLPGFAYDRYPGRDETRLITRILELKENFLARARIWGVLPGRLTAGAAPSQSVSDRERRALKNRIAEAIEKAKQNHFQMTDLEISKVDAWLDALFTPSSGQEEDVGQVTIPKGLWSEISAILQDRSYTAQQNRTDAERNLEKRRKLNEQSSEADARGKHPVEKSSEGDDLKKPDNEDDDKMSKKAANVEFPTLEALADDFMNSLKIPDVEKQDILDGIDTVMADDFMNSLKIPAVEKQDIIDTMDFVMSPKRSMQSHGESIPAGVDYPVVGEEGWPKLVSINPSAQENLPDSNKGTDGSGGNRSAIFSDQQSKASGEDAEEEKKPGDDKSPK